MDGKYFRNNTCLGSTRLWHLSFKIIYIETNKRLTSIVHLATFLEKKTRGMF
jgi:hypothetical protein